MDTFRDRLSTLLKIQGATQDTKLEYLETERVASFGFKLDAEENVVPRIYVGNDFFNHSSKSQDFLLAHEVGHVRQFEESPYIWMGCRLLVPNSIMSWMFFGYQSFTALRSGALIAQGLSSRTAKTMFAISTPLVVGMSWAWLYARHLEYDADARGVRALNDSAGAFEFFNSLDRARNSSIFDDHPCVADRIERIKKLPF
jgi:hypothetical protein